MNLLTISSLLSLCIGFFSTQAQAYDTFDQMATDMAAKFSAPIIKIHLLKPLLSGSTKVLILDTREKSEFKISHIKDAIFVGYDNFNMEETLKKIPKGTHVITYCSVGYRSGDIATRLRKKGINASNFYGGIFGWVNAGNTVYSSPGTTTNKIHGYGPDWGKWVKIGSVVY